jgi:serine protease
MTHRFPLSPFALSLVWAVGCAAQAASDSPEEMARPNYRTADLPDDAAAHIPGVVVVDFKDGTTKAEFDEYEKAWGIDLELADDEEGKDSAITLGGFAGSEEEKAVLLERIRADPRVEAAEPLMKLTTSWLPDDPMFGQQWNLKLINMPKAWERARGKGVVVAVLDTGIAWENRDEFVQVPDLDGAKFVEGYDFINDDQNADDDHGHGTHVAGTIAQVTNNHQGVAGIAFEATLMPVKVLDHFGSGNSAEISDAIRWAADHGAKVINLSLGGGGRSLVMEHAVEYARAKGAVVVCAAGNGGRGVVEFPAAYPGAVAVGAVGPAGERAPYSSWGKELDIAAPGGDKSHGDEGGIVQNTIDPRDIGKAVYASYQGTSMATPHVAGVAALLWSAGAKSPEQVEKALFLGARRVGAHGWTEQYGHGVLDAEGALDALKKPRGAELTGLLPDEVQAATEPAGTTAMRAEAIEVAAYAPADWKALGFAVALLALVLLTLARKERPGLLNILVKPGFLIPLVLSTVGVFFLDKVAAPSELTTAAALPLPDWLNRIIFGRGSLASPLVYSAAIPILGALFALKFKAWRSVVGGLAIGFGAILGYSAWAHAPALAWLPFAFLAIPWLVTNAIICLFIARAMLKRGAV